MARLFTRLISRLRQNPVAPPILRPDIGARVIRSLHLKDRAPIPSLNSELQGVVILEDNTRDVTQLHDENDRPRSYSRFLNAPAVAAQFSKVALINPVDPRFSGDFVVTEIWITPTATMNSKIALVPLLGGATLGLVEDLRVVPAQGSMGLLDINTAAAEDTSDQLEVRGPNTATIVLKDLGFIVPPGFMCSVGGRTVNQGITVTFRWIEFATDRK